MSADEIRKELLEIAQEIEIYYRDNSSVVVPPKLKKRQRELAALLKKCEE